MTINSHVRTPLWQKFLLLLFGIAAALVLFIVLLLLFPSIVQGDRYARTGGSTTLDVQFHHTDGDTFGWLPGKIRPPEDDPVLTEFTLAWDSEGFRVPQHMAAAYPIAAFGDSFTEGPQAPLPWPDKLAEIMNVPVRNYGYRGYGPLEIRQAVTDFAAREPRQWVLYAYFAGNDLSEANHVTAQMERSPLHLLPHLAADSAQRLPDKAPAQTLAAHYDFPMPVIIRGFYHEMVLLPRYLWWQLAPPEGFAASRTLGVVGAALDAMANAVPEPTCLALIFIPTKERLYYRYLVEPRWMLGIAEAQRIGEDGLLTFVPQPMPPEAHETVLARLDEQRNAIAALAAQRPRWLFIDLTPAFEEAVAVGNPLLYYPYDSHWNQAGHDLAAQVIADALAVAGCGV